MSEVSEVSEVDQIRDWLQQHVHRYYERGSSEFQIMHDVLLQHPNFSNWKFQEVIAFKVTRSPKKKYLQVEAKFLASGWRTVSWKACSQNVNYKEKTDLEKLSSAMRYSIREQVRAFRSFTGSKKCAICESEHGLEVDHDKSHKLFSQLRNDFIGYHGYPAAFWWVKKANSFRISNAKKWDRKWQQYHADHAKLRLLCQQ